jgi:mannose/fructose/N-acetylgalactosamine-specific phosphotransferase system component IID
MAKPVVTVVETLTLSNGKSPVSISQTANKIIPKLLPAKLSATLIFLLL